MIVYDAEASALVKELAKKFYNVNTTKHNRTIVVNGMQIEFDSIPAAGYVRFSTAITATFNKDGTLIMAFYETMQPSKRGKQAMQFNVDPRIIQGPLIAARTAKNGNAVLLCHNFNRVPENPGEVVHTLISTGGNIKALAIGEVLNDEIIRRLL